MNTRYTHDCDKCVSLGQDGNADLYFCEQMGMPTVIARFSNEGGDYISGLAFAEHDRHIREAKLRAIEKGLIK